MWHLVQLNEFGAFFLIWEKKGIFLFFQIPFSSIIFCTGQLPRWCIWGTEAFLAVNDFVSFPFSHSLPSSTHRHLPWDYENCFFWGKSLDSEGSFMLCGEKTHENWLYCVKSKVLRDHGTGQVRSLGDFQVADGPWIGGEGGEPENRDLGKVQGGVGRP